MLRMGLVGRHHTVFYCVCVLQPHSSVFVDKHFPQVSYDGADDETSPPQPVVVVMQLAQLGLYNSTLSLAHRKSCFHCTAISGTHQHPFIVSYVQLWEELLRCLSLRSLLSSNPAPVFCKQMIRPDQPEASVFNSLSRAVSLLVSFLTYLSVRVTTSLSPEGLGWSLTGRAVLQTSGHRGATCWSTVTGAARTTRLE